MSDFDLVDDTSTFFAPVSSDLVDGLIGQYQHMRAKVERVALQNAAALILGYFTAAAFRVPEYDRRAIAIEVGIQNSALALVIVFTFFDGLGGMAVIAAWWGVWHLISGLTLGTFWARRPPAVPHLADVEAGV